jgi:hypothetical protein
VEALRVSRQVRDGGVTSPVKARQGDEIGGQFRRAKGGTVATSSEAVDCAQELARVEQEKERLKNDEESADREQQEAAAKKVHLSDQRGLLDTIGPANTAWEAARGTLIEETKKICDDLATCASRTSSGLGDDASCLNQAYDEHSAKRQQARADARRLKHELAAADADLTQAKDDLQAALDRFNNVFAQFAVWMGAKRDEIKARQAAFIAARADEACDPKQAWVLLQLALASCKEFDEKKELCIPKEMRELLEEIEGLQETVRTKETAKARKATELTATEALLAAQDTDIVAAVLVLFAKCKQESSDADTKDHVKAAPATAE